MSAPTPAEQGLAARALAALTQRHMESAKKASVDAEAARLQAEQLRGRT